MKKLLKWFKRNWFVPLIIIAYAISIYQSIIKSLEISTNVYMTFGIFALDIIWCSILVQIGFLTGRAIWNRKNFWPLIKIGKIKCAFHYHKPVNGYSIGEYRPDVLHVTTYCHRCGLMIKSAQVMYDKLPA